jgi:cytidylate kinase|tara:strand:- start:113 stop:820 length:708 start_codon:yes stop_codon:yes gene_type:complete
MSNRIPVIAIDGPSGSGKGVITHRLAKHLGFHILDSGALYRLIGLAARMNDVELDAEPELARLAADLSIEFEPTDDAEEPIRILLDGQDVTLTIRSDEAGSDASRVSPYPRVRGAIRKLQRDCIRSPGLIADGRDMGTVVFTDADVKIYLTASAEARAKRRYKQLKGKDINVSVADLFLSIQQRDERDMNREVAPLKAAEDAIIVDSTEMSTDEVFARVLEIVIENIGLNRRTNQ